MTFNQIAQAIQDRDASSGIWLTLEQAKKRAVYEILEGFRELNDACEWLKTFREHEAMLWTLYGYEVDAEALEAAIRYREQE